MFVNALDDLVNSNTVVTLRLEVKNIVEAFLFRWWLLGLIFVRDVLEFDVYFVHLPVVNKVVAVILVGLDDVLTKVDNALACLLAQSDSKPKLMTLWHLFIIVSAVSEAKESLFACVLKLELAYIRPLGAFAPLVFTELHDFVIVQP